jgi:hypothetical protein
VRIACRATTRYGFPVAIDDSARGKHFPGLGPVSAGHVSALFRVLLILGDFTHGFASYAARFLYGPRLPGWSGGTPLPWRGPERRMGR